MQIQRTTTLLLDFDADLLQTLHEFQKVQQQISPVCFGDGSEKPLHAVALQKACYTQIVGEVSAQMKCSAIRLVAGAYTSTIKNYQRRVALDKEAQSAL